MPQPLFFMPPDDPFVENADLAYIIERVLNGGPAYWWAGSRHAGIYLGKALSHVPSLALVLFTPNFGFYLEAMFPVVSGDHRGTEAFIPDAQLGRSEVFVQQPGGFRLPRDFCVNPERCAEIVNAFCLRGELHPGTNWVKKRETGWEFIVECDEDE